MKNNLFTIFTVSLLAFETFILALTMYKLIDKVQEIETNQRIINEYILNRIGG